MIGLGVLGFGSAGRALRWLLVIMLVAVLVFALFGRCFTGLDPLATVARPWTPPNNNHPLGTDVLGRDVLARLYWG
ncbi:MAG: hypothetical protein WA927_19675, partial [Rhodococcus sp. (in: high G+C Gram-positive bacteria)]